MSKVTECHNVEFHEIANVFPLLSDAEREQLAADIARNGLFEPIMLHEGKILDGRNRFLACQQAGVEARFETYSGSDAVGYVVSLNLCRRHLDSSQRAACAVEAEAIMERLQEEAAARRAATLKQSTDSQRIDERDKGRADDKAAALFRTNRQYLSEARRIRTEDPASFARVKAGELTIPKAKQLRKREEWLSTIATESRPLASLGKFPVIYADPPWRYEHHVTESRAIENQYPTMSLEDICALEVPATDDAMLFLWAPCPKLKAAMQVIDAWGFTYRTSMAWVKPSIGMGYYVRQRHEYLLIAKRGDIPTPATPDRPDSVIEASRGAHSEKPSVVYELIERMYPTLPKVELFARCEREGWVAWGNEVA